MLPTGATRIRDLAMPALAVPGLVAVAAWLFAGCGGATETVTVGGPTTNAPTSALTTGGRSTSGSTTTTSPGKAPSEPPTSFVHTAAFQTPTGNIGCMIIGGSARCDIVHRSWSPPARPADCPSLVDFGQGLIVGSSGVARVVCAGDTARDPTSPKLPYGTASEVEGFTCVSRSSGMTCTEDHSGHGFFISIQRYLLF